MIQQGKLKLKKWVRGNHELFYLYAGKQNNPFLDEIISLNENKKEISSTPVSNHDAPSLPSYSMKEIEENDKSRK